VPSHLLNDVQHWRDRARESRGLAEQMNDALAREMMFRVASNFERMAEQASSDKMKGKSNDETHPFRGRRITDMRILRARALRSKQSDGQSCAHDTAVPEHDDPLMSDQLRHAGNELHEQLHSDRRTDRELCGSS
jgi:predicted Zn-dependent protease